MDEELQGKVALVTGGMRGIGLAIAKALARRGALTVLGDILPEAAGQEAVAVIEGIGGRAEAIHLDVTDSAAVAAAVKDLAGRHGTLDILVANAGVSIDGLLLRTKDDQLDKTLAVNLKGTFYCCREAAKTMVRKRAGRIVMIASVVGEAGNPGQVAYSASKAAIIGMTKTLARELAGRGILVNAIAPGFVETEMTAYIQGDMREAMLKSVPLGRIGAPEDVAEAVAFLVGPGASYITGHVLRVNGGMYM
jgi:3-oxoacyl-[acyl-carrier protein] reductase